jgi:hypothetical protein
MGQDQPVALAPQQIPRDQRGAIDAFLHLESDTIQRCKQTPFQRAKLASRSPQLFAEQEDSTLEKQIQTQRGFSTFPERDLLKVLESAVYALAYIQKKKCAYLSVSPANILFFNGAALTRPQRLQAGLAPAHQPRRPDRGHAQVQPRPGNSRSLGLAEASAHRPVRTCQG